MRHILRISIILMITMMISSCFENVNNLQIRGVVSGVESDDGKSCSYAFKMGEENLMMSDEDTMMDLAYTKLAGINSHNYSYLLPLGIINTLPSEMKSRSELNGTVNSIQTKNIIVKTYSDQNVLIDTDVITKNVIIDPQTGTVLFVPLFRNTVKWEREGDNEENAREYLYSSFYDNDNGNGLLTRYVTVDVVVNAETLSGEYASSNHFKFKINLCVDCLLCPGGSCTTPNSLVSACQDRGFSTPTALFSRCGLYQDSSILCQKVSGQ